MAKKLNIPLIVSGGIASLTDIKKLKKFEALGIEGIIIGKALYKGSILLEEALKLAQGKIKDERGIDNAY
jgi:phosphoribosylformimino-5-aminoimidazole carboxamide ribotide isomerase